MVRRELVRRSRVRRLPHVPGHRQGTLRRCLERFSHVPVCACASFTCTLHTSFLSRLTLPSMSVCQGTHCASWCNAFTTSFSVFTACQGCTAHKSGLAVGVTFATSPNVCAGAKPTGVVGGINWDNQPCVQNGVIAAVEQAGGDVTLGYEGGLNVDGRTPITTPYYQNGMCPVNVHWHLGTEHRSAGEYDENGSGPSHRRELAANARLGMQCHHYDSTDAKFTTEFEWKHCTGMHVGETYEVHWPHSAAGACGTLDQFQTPFYDGVFCSSTAVGLVLSGAITSWNAIGVQAQVFTIVNDEDYYYPDLMRGMIVDGDFGSDIAAYTGSTTGTSRDNSICSSYAPITWQVDRKCHMISASTFDKMCADMKAQKDDMSGDVYPHGSRELVANQFTANNLAQQSNPLFRE